MGIRTLGIVIAGGLSTRMGRDKTVLPLGGVPLVMRALDRLRPQVSLLALNSETAPVGLPSGVRCVADALPGRLGPLSGILAGLRLARQHRGITHLSTVAADTPFFPTDLVDRLAAACDGPETIAIAASAGVLHPVFGLWPVPLEEDLADFLANDPKRRVRGFIARHPHIVVDIPVTGTSSGDIDPFLNINTQDDLDMATRLLPAALETQR